jgi:histidinol-phosphatase (PHP family)
MNALIVDYHIHTSTSPDGEGDFAQCINEAQKKGIDEIGFSEHLLDRPVRPIDFFHGYVERFLQIKKDTPIPVRLGAEVDYFPDQIEAIKRLVARFPFDYVIGSVHFLEDWPIDSYKQLQLYFRKDIMNVYEEYFAAIRQLCRSRLFDVVGHVDIVKIFGYRPESDITSILEDTAQAIAENDICVEVNTAGLLRPCREIYPSRQLLEMLRQRNVPVTLASDAHKPEHVGRDLEKALNLISDVGYTHICTFESRKRKAVRITRAEEI